MGVTAEQRRKTGFKSGKAKGKYPMANERECISAVKLRHHSKVVSAEAVLNKATRAANAHGWSR